MTLPKLTRDLLLIRVEKEDKTKSGISLPETYVEEKMITSTRGIVEVAGPEATIPVGAEVNYKSYVGNKIEPKNDDGKHWHIIVSELDVLSYYTEEK